jgi:asparagine synthase (glutamine-hydrolysing)
MCGILGIWGGLEDPVTNVRKACAVLRHRGPDDDGIWYDERAALALGHTRLAILDLSVAGQQPMSSRDGRYVIVFNGEIYNHLMLRQELEAQGGKPLAWRGHSDTETLLDCIATWGLEKSLQKAHGMFAFAVWDRRANELSLARDRMGEKPLYYGYFAKSFAFGSELKGFEPLPGFSRDIDRSSLAALMRLDYVPAPRSIYRGIKKLPAGTYLKIGVADLSAAAIPVPRTYWSAFEQIAIARSNPLTFSSEHEATDALDHVLRRAVADQMIADVPVGAFLSGGIDSSAVVSFMQSHTSRPVKTFSIGFDVPGYNEAEHAKTVASYLGTDHNELYLTAQDAASVIPKLPSIYDEPFADSSQIATYLVAQLARQHVTVSLSGDGADEVFGGYNRYFVGARLWQHLRRTPRSIRSLLSSAILSGSPKFWDVLYACLAPFVPATYRLAMPGEALHKGARLLNVQSDTDLYNGLISRWEPRDIVLRDSEPEPLFDAKDVAAVSTLAELMMALDTVTYLPDDILVKLDRAAMAVSLETRVPFLDPRVFEFAWRLPLKYKVRGGVGKWLLREVLSRYMPRRLTERPKMGFAVPLDAWLRGPLRDWAEDLLNEGKLRRQGYLDPQPIQRKWAEHLSGRRNWQHYLWNVLMFQAWLEGTSRA